MAKHYYEIPDCPRCGEEMQQYMKYLPKTQTKDNPFGKKYKWCECEKCGYKKEVK